MTELILAVIEDPLVYRSVREIKKVWNYCNPNEAIVHEALN